MVLVYGVAAPVAGMLALGVMFPMANWKVSRVVCVRSGGGIRACAVKRSRLVQGVKDRSIDFDREGTIAFPPALGKLLLALR